MSVNHRANILAAAIMITVIIAGSIIFSQYQIGITPQEEVDAAQRTQEVAAQADVVMRQAVNIGISEWLERGFNDQTKLWYDNKPYPPTFETAKQSLLRIVASNIEEQLNVLQSDSPDLVLESPTVDFDIGNSLTQQDLEQLSVNIDGFTVELETDDRRQIEDLSTSFEVASKAWLFYTKMQEWMTTNAGGLTQKVFEGMQSNNCQLVTGECECSDAFFDTQMVNDAKLKSSDVRDSIGASVAELQALFPADSGIVCDYTVDKMNIENVDFQRWLVQEIGPYVTASIPMSNKYVYELNSWDDETQTLPEAGADTSNTVNVDNGVTGSYNPGAKPHDTCHEESVGDFIRLGMMGIDKKAASLITVYCEDPSQTVSTSQGFRSLRAEIQIRFSLAQNCPIPVHDKIPPVPPQDQGTCGAAADVEGDPIPCTDAQCAAVCGACRGDMYTDDTGTTWEQCSENVLCAESGQGECCNGVCCGAGMKCCNNQCIPGSMECCGGQPVSPGSCCFGTPCNGNCCASTKTCGACPPGSPAP